MTDIRSAPEESGALETLLRALRRQKDEVQLTECLVSLASVDAGVGHGLALALLGAASRDPQIGSRAGSLLRVLPSEVSWKGEVPVVGDRRRVGMRRARRHGRIDWLLEAKDRDEGNPLFLLGVEVKIEARIENPLKAYYDHLKRRQADAWGLLVLARNRPVDGLLDVDQDHWLGVALWRDVIAELERVQPSTKALASVWPALLCVLSADDDLGATEITLENLSTEGTRLRLEILAEHARATVEVTATEALRSRTGRRSAGEIFVDVVVDRRSQHGVVLNCYVDRDLYPNESPAIELKLSVVDGSLYMTSRVEPLALPRRLVRKATRTEQESAFKRLEALEPGFRADGDECWVRDVMLRTTQDDLRDVVAEETQKEVDLVIATGILDRDL
jgi:hypothetical protein